MRNVVPFVIVLLLAMAKIGFGQDQDTAFIPPEPDSTRQPAPEPDSLIQPDSLTGAEEALLQFEEKRKEYEEEKVERRPNLCFLDSLSTYFLSPRLNQRASVEQSYYVDAGDYFRFDPSYFVIDYVSSPMRKTVQPFGLSGDRLNVISNGLPLHPFEHYIEPDGQIDLNDIPTAGDHDQYVVPGAAGMLFEGSNSTASLITYPQRPDSSAYESAFLVDQGSFEFNHVRGSYSRLFSSGREIDLSIGYRNGDGEFALRKDDTYHYTGRLYQPLGLDYGFSASGHLYDRGGQYWVARTTGAGTSYATFARERIDRSAEISFERHNADHTARYLLGYRYLRQGSHMMGTYRGAFDYGGRGFFVAREWVSGSSLLKVEVSSSHLNYNNGYEDFIRDDGRVSARYVKYLPQLRYAVMAGTGYIDGFDWLPSAALVITLDRPGWYMLLSAGYSEQAPSLHQLHLRFQRVYMYSDDVEDYADAGNGALEKEKQLVASGLVELGGIHTNIKFTLTGGKINGGIDWQNARIPISGESVYTLFQPANGDIDFLNASVQQKLRLSDILNLRSGLAYHNVNYANIEDKPYLPDYQLFSGLELHCYWPQRIMHLYVYGEISYCSEYDGYHYGGYGDVLVANVKLSFRIKGFRFHFVIQNALSAEHYAREGLLIPGRYSFFGLTWNFMD